MSHIGKSLGLLSIFSSGIGVISPLYGACVFSFYGGYKYKGLVSAVHYLLLFIFIIFYEEGELLIPFLGTKMMMKTRKTMENTSAANGDKKSL